MFEETAKKEVGEDRKELRKKPPKKPVYKRVME